MNLNAIKEKLLQHYGSEKMYKNPLIPSCWYSEGVKHYYELAKCFWLHDILMTEFHSVIKLAIPDVYYLRITIAYDEAHIVLTDYEKTVLHQRHIDFTDHPEGEILLHMGWDGQKSIICLPSEN